MEEKPTHKDISYIVKVTNNCNMGCQYCYYRHNRSRTPENRMSREVLRQTIFSMLDYNREYANFIWHGGEPLMMERDFFEAIVDMQQEYIRETGKDIVISNCIQTNGVLLDSDWIDFFVENDFNVSISLDGFFDLHARNRGTNREAFDAIMNSVSQLSDRKVPFSVLTVVTKETIGQEEELFDFFADYDISSFGFLPMNYGDDKDSLSPEDYGAFLRRFFELWITKGKMNISIREFDEFMRGYLGQAQRLCHHTDLCDCYFTVTPTGDLYPCDCFPQNENTLLGSVFSSISEAHEANRAFFKLGHAMPDECNGCEYEHICNGGCRYHRWLKSEDFSKRQFYCESYKVLYSDIAACLAAGAEQA